MISFTLIRNDLVFVDSFLGQTACIQQQQHQQHHTKWRTFGETRRFSELAEFIAIETTINYHLWVFETLKTLNPQNNAVECRQSYK